MFHRLRTKVADGGRALLQISGALSDNARVGWLGMSLELDSVPPDSTFVQLRSRILHITSPGHFDIA
jgi:hypothetical protein